MPNLLVYAGPNGSGKSTITSKIGTIREYVNADAIKASLRSSDMEAALKAERTREYLLAHNKDFTFETVLSTDRNLNLMIRAKEKGYCITCFYVLTNDPSINIERVNKRVQSGGHSVPEEKIVERWKKALHLFPALIPICDELYVIDNSIDRKNTESCLIMKKIDKEVEIYPNERWNDTSIKSLINGSFQ